MNANDLLLLAILAAGMILINWNIIKRDLFSFQSFSSPGETLKVDSSPVDKRKELPSQV